MWTFHYAGCPESNFLPRLFSALIDLENISQTDNLIIMISIIAVGEVKVAYGLASVKPVHYSTVQTQKRCLINWLVALCYYPAAIGSWLISTLLFERFLDI